MNVRVTLLQESELRHQGLLNRRFLLLAAIGAGALVVVLLIGWGLWRWHGHRQDWQTARTTWAKTEPRYVKFQALQADYGRIKALADELQGWRHARLALSTVLAEVQRLVAPRPIQFERLTVTSQIELIVPPSPPPREVTGKPAAKRGAAEGAVTPAPAPPAPGVPARKFRIMIEGRAAGEQSYQEVVGLGNDLRTAPALAGLFDSVRLQGLRQVSDAKERPDERLFSIECVLLPRKIE